MKTILFLALSLCMGQIYAARYTANKSATVTLVKIYNSDLILVGLDVMPTDISCPKNTYFVVSSDIPEKLKDRYYSMLLMAASTKKTIAVGYDNSSDQACQQGYPILYALAYY